MEAYDFEYDGIALSDMGYILCQFDSGGLQTLSNGSAITFDLVSTLSGAKQELTGASYSECLTATLQICKDPSAHDDLSLTTEDIRDLTSWLNRKEFHKFKLLDDEYFDFYFEASFNISRLEVSGRVCGLELEMITNRPFALREPKFVTIRNEKANGSAVIYNASDEEGHLYPHMEITVAEDGDLEIVNDRDDTVMHIAGCSAGEVITLDYPLIQTSLSSHKIENDFNWSFFRLASSFKNKKNTLTISLPCDIKISYSPIAKIGI